MFDRRDMMIETIDYAHIEQLQHAQSLIDQERPLPSDLKMKWWEFKQSVIRKIDRFIPVYTIRNIFFTPRNRSNLLAIPTLTYQYSDPRCKLLHANFTILVDFIEKEEPFRIVDWDATKEHRHAADELLDLYRWWKTDPFAQDPSGPENFYDIRGPGDLIQYGRSVYGDEDNWIADVIQKSTCRNILHILITGEAENRADAQLIRLMKVRQSMWC